MPDPIKLINTVLTTVPQGKKQNHKTDENPGSHSDKYGNLQKLESYFIDANGDGVLNDGDTSVVIQHWDNDVVSTRANHIGANEVGFTQQGDGPISTHLAHYNDDISKSALHFIEPGHENETNELSEFLLSGEQNTTFPVEREVKH